jgi:hypothetical protein
VFFYFFSIHDRIPCHIAPEEFSRPWPNGVSGRHWVLRAFRNGSHMIKYAALFEFARALPDSPILVCP